MKLAYLTSRFPFSPLGETFLAAEARLLAGLCDEVHVIPARPETERPLFGDLGTIDVRMSPRELKTLTSALLEVVLHPLRAARAFGVLAFSRYPLKAKLKNLALLPKALAVSRYVRAHGIDHIHAHWMTTSSTIAYVCHIMTGIAWSCTAHAHDIFSRNLTAAKAGSAQFVRVISVRNHGTLSELTAHRYDERLYVGHLGVEVPDSSAPLRAANDIVTMVCPARLHPMKGHMDLLDALARLRDAGCKFHCDLAGDGPLRAAIEERIAQLGLQKHVTIRGVVPHSVLLAQLRSGTYDLVALSSIEEPALKGFFEGIPVALMEPMAAGVPCVSTTIGSIPELIDEQCGSLVEQHDAQAFADAIARFARNPLLRQRAGIAARRRVQREFNTVETTRELYERICAASERGHGGTPSLNKPRSIPTANAN